jgi:phage terminase small subunit
MKTAVATKGRPAAKKSALGTAAREAAFVEAYLSNNMRGDLAAIVAGYAPAHAKRQAVAMLARPAVQKLIRDRQDELSKAHRLTTDSVMAELSKIVHADPRKLFDDSGTLLPIRQWPDDMAGAVASIEVDELFDGKGKGRKFIGYTKKVKFWDKNSGIEKAMKHLGLFAEDNKQRMGALSNLPRDVLQAIVERLQAAGGGKLIDGHATRV